MAFYLREAFGLDLPHKPDPEEGPATGERNRRGANSLPVAHLGRFEWRGHQNKKPPHRRAAPKAEIRSR